MYFFSIVLRFFIKEIIHLTIFQITSLTSFSYAGSTDDLLFKGDIIVRPTQRSGDRIIHGRWPGGIIYYQFENIGGPSQTLIKSMMGNLYHSTNGCIEFVPRDNESDYLLIKDHEQKCAATIGNAGGDNNTMVLGPMCFNASVILHELYHVIGFPHEHNRWNRDYYVDIIWGNILEGEKHNFDRISSHDMNDYGLDYDYESIVHYDQYAFSKNGRRTIMIDERRPEKDQKYQNIIGKVNTLSLSNLRAIKSKYMCSIYDDEYENSWRDNPKLQGDIVFRPFLRWDKIYGGQKWDGGVIYYQFENIDNASQTLIRSVMENYYNSTNSCIEFIPRVKERKYLIIKNHEKKCASTMGFHDEGDMNIMFLGPMCFSTAVILHELYHVLGFYDEHNRLDRDRHVTINWENILEGEKSNMEILFVMKNDLDYDYESVTHGGQFAFSKNGKMTIKTEDKRYQTIIGKANILSPLNILKIKNKYNCN